MDSASHRRYAGDEEHLEKVLGQKPDLPAIR
jgi:hypothetical protein